MKITVLSENTARDGYLCEHGLSLYIETANHRILFDMGQGDLFSQNAERAGIHLKETDIAVLSHGHYDHGGGLLHFLSLNHSAKVYLSKYAFGSFYNGEGRYIGLPPELQGNPRLTLVTGGLSIDKGITLFGDEDTRHIPDSFGLTEGNHPDLFRHELYLKAEEDGQKVLFSGCSHRGILHIMEQNPAVTACVGGFHLMKQENPHVLLEIAKALAGYPCRYYTCHCTGEAQFQALQQCMGEKLHSLSAGDSLEL